MSIRLIMKRAWIILSIIVMAVIFFFSSQPSVTSNEVSEYLADKMNIVQKTPWHIASNQDLMFGLSLRKYAHLVLYMIMGFSVYMACENKKKSMLVSCVICYLYAIFDEVHQSFVSGRSGTFSDTLIDLMGVFIGIIVAIGIIRLKKRFNKVC